MREEKAIGLLTGTCRMCTKKKGLNFYFSISSSMNKVSITYYNNKKDKYIATQYLYNYLAPL